ncbi:MAG: right-handed parallel beta-helix repeat-containing protein [Limisphaerales bacterium]
MKKLNLFFTLLLALGFDCGAAPTVYVTSLKDGGRGTLREAVSRGNRRIEFKVGGEIKLKKILEITVHDLGIDGSRAPRPGITITGSPFSLKGVRNTTVRHLRFRMSSDDNLRISGACRNLLIENCSSTHGGDGAIDITEDYKTKRRPDGVIIRNCLIGATDKAMLVVAVDNLTLEGNLFTNTGQRNPQVREAKNFNIINNVVRNFTVYGLLARAGSTGNFVGNAYPLSPLLPKRPDRTVRIDHKIGACRIYTSGNVGPAKYDLNRLGNSTRPIGRLPDGMVTANKLTQIVPSRVGARPLDRIDAALVKNDPSIKFRPSRTKDK